jgi:phage shock protein PspC (stress-responsive transcriptional regulator)
MKFSILSLQNISGASMKRLFLSSSDKKLGGVCGGIAEYMELDPTIVRLLTVVLALITAIIPVLIGYILAWIIVPRKPVP